MTSAKTKHDALLDELLKDYTAPKDILGEHGLLKQLTKRVVERALDAELTAHLGYAPHVRHGGAEGNARNGTSHKTVQTDTGPLPLEGPRLPGTHLVEDCVGDRRDEGGRDLRPIEIFQMPLNIAR